MYFGNQSGAIVAQIAGKLFQDLGYNVSVFSSEIHTDAIGVDNVKLYHRKAFNGLSNWKEKEYIKEYERVLEDSSATIIFTVGSITNKNLCYLEIAKKRGLKVISKIFMQDFFCVKSYANDIKGPCTKCLDYNYFQAFKNKCIINNPIDYVKTANGIMIRKKLSKILPQIDFVITSTDEQIGFYRKFGISKEKCIKLPLFFDHNKLKEIEPKMGEYFVCIAQNRIEKGFQYLGNILRFCNSTIKIIAAYNNKEQANIAIEKYGFQEFIDNGMLEIMHDLQWDNGLAELVANSRGVIIPSIWPTTTEYGLLEALGYRKPIFCFDVGIHHELIENGINGFISKIGDVETIAKQLMLLKSDDTLYERISYSAGILYKQMTHWDEWKKSLQNIGL